MVGRHSLTYLPTHPLTHLLTNHSLTYLPTHSHTLPHTHSSTHPPTHSHTLSLTHSLTHPLTHSHTHSPTHSPTHSHTHSLTHTPTHSLTHSHAATTDYIPVSQNITFSPNGPTTHRVNITINDDSLFEGSESLTISLTPLPPHQSRIRVVGGNATIRIQDNDSECCQILHYHFNF